LVISKLSCNVKGGIMPGKHLANIVLPEPGEPTIRMLYTV